MFCGLYTSAPLLPVALGSFQSETLQYNLATSDPANEDALAAQGSHLKALYSSSTTLLSFGARVPFYITI